MRYKYTTSQVYWGGSQAANAAFDTLMCSSDLCGRLITFVVKRLSKEMLSVRTGDLLESAKPTYNRLKPQELSVKCWPQLPAVC